MFVVVVVVVVMSTFIMTPLFVALNWVLIFTWHLFLKFVMTLSLHLVGFDCDTELSLDSIRTSQRNTLQWSARHTVLLAFSEAKRMTNYQSIFEVQLCCCFLLLDTIPHWGSWCVASRNVCPRTSRSGTACHSTRTASESGPFWFCCSPDSGTCRRWARMDTYRARALSTFDR